jgi:hypothetical protein
VEAYQPLRLALHDLTNTVPVGVFHISILDDAKPLESGKRTLRPSHSLVLGQDLAATDNLASIAIDVSILVTLTASKLGDVALDETSERNSLLVDDIALLVEVFAVQRTVIQRLLILLLSWLGMTLGVSKLIDDVAIFVDLHTDETFRIALGDFSHLVAVLILDLTTLDNVQAFETGEWALRTCDTLALGDRLASTSDLAPIIV